MNITQGLFNQMAAANSCELLNDNKAKEIFNIKGEFFICVTTRSSQEKGFIEIDLQKCVHIKSYSGPTLSYAENTHLINKGLKERDYKGMWFTCKGDTYVIVSDKIRAFPIPEGSQTQLF